MLFDRKISCNMRLRFCIYYLKGLTILTSFVFMLILSACKHHTTCNELVFINDRWVNSENEYYTGKCVNYYENESVSIEMELKNGLKHGKFFRYYPNGNISFSSHYCNGEICNTSKHFFKNGNLKSIRFPHKDLWIYAEWDIDNKLNTIREENNDFLIDGRMVTYNTNEKVHSCINYSNALKNGRFIIFYDNGSVNISGSYANDAHDKTWLLFNEYNNIVAIEKFNRGIKIGEWKYFYDNGQVKSEILFINNKIIKKTEWSAEGKKTDSFIREIF